MTTRESVVLQGHIGKNIQSVHDLVMSDSRISTRIITDKLGIRKCSVRTILKEDLNMRKMCAKIVPKVLTQEQTQRRVGFCQDWLENEEGSDFLQWVITGDGSWIYKIDRETKRHSEEWKHGDSPRSKRARKSRSKIKSMLIVFFNIRGVVHHDFVPQGQTVNAAFYVEVSKRLRESLRRVRPELWTEKNPIQLHDNAPSHSALIVLEFSPKTT
jgi:hypothetical protein